MTVEIQPPIKGKHVMAGDYELQLVDHKGRVFNQGFMVYQELSQGSGWYVFGRCKENVIKLVARPDLPARYSANYNIQSRRGWRIKKHAEMLAVMLESQYRGVDPDQLATRMTKVQAVSDMRIALEEAHSLLKDLSDFIPSDYQDLTNRYYATEQVVHLTLEKYKDIK